MSTTNYPEVTNEPNAPKKSYKNLIIGILSLALVGTVSGLLIQKSNNGATIAQQQAKIDSVTIQKSEIQNSFDASLARLDSLSTSNTALEGKLTESNKEIAQEKAEIRRILNKKNATVAELAKAKELIASLNDKINGLEQQIAQLTQENQNLTAANQTLTQEKETLNQNLATTTATKDSLANKVDIASTLNASNITITPIDVRKSGKEKVTTKAKRVDKLVVSFDVDNRIAKGGQTDLYVCVIGPDGKPITAQALNSGTFTTREEGSKAYTTMVPINFETSKKQNVQFSFAPGKFVQGNYTIEIYQNGFLIGQGTKSLRKGGLFS
jgi:peptidoglycan hydrolase CwlO-like protein